MTTFMSRLSASIVIAAAAGAVGVAQNTPGPSGWSASNYDQSANRYSPLTQIAPANVSTLQQAWSIHLKPVGYSGKLLVDEAIPIVIGNMMYLGSPYGEVIALDATSGAEKWRYQLPNNDIPAKRGVAYWPGAGARAASIIFGSNAGALYSLIDPVVSDHFQESDHHRRGHRRRPRRVQGWWRRPCRRHPRVGRDDGQAGVDVPHRAAAG